MGCLFLSCIALALFLLGAGPANCRTRKTGSPVPEPEFVNALIPVCDPRTLDCQERIMAEESKRELVFHSGPHNVEITIQGIKKGAQNVAIYGPANFYEGEVSFGPKPRLQHLAKKVGWKPMLSAFELRGFADMCYLDPLEFNATNYGLEYLGDETSLGKLCWVFYVRPNKHAKGRHFRGRIWVSPDCLAIVKAQGAFHPMRKILPYFLVEDYWYEFTAWWKVTSDGKWVPDFICAGVSVSESDFTNPAFRGRIVYDKRMAAQPGSEVDDPCGMNSVQSNAQGLRP